ncbi:hypothetical protein BIY40_00385 [Pediococcus acidilactici]|nr:hypothetical protein BIY40_00385 [Pediococcus acidilactici]
MKSISEHKKGIEDVGKILVTYFVAKKLASGARSVWDIYKGIKGIASIPFKAIKGVFSLLKPKNIKLGVKWVGQKTLNIARGAVTAFGKMKAKAIAAVKWTGRTIIKLARTAVQGFSKLKSYAIMSAKWTGKTVVKLAQASVRGFGKLKSSAIIAAKWTGRTVVKLARASITGIGNLKSYAILGAKWVGGKAVSLAVRGFTLVRNITMTTLIPAMSSYGHLSCQLMPPFWLVLLLGLLLGLQL